MSSFKDALSCSHCRKLMYPAPMYAFCESDNGGHFLCQVCKGENGRMCPVKVEGGPCMTTDTSNEEAVPSPVVEGPFPLFEALFNAAKFQCKYYSLGCRKVLSSDELRSHDVECAYRPPLPCRLDPRCGFFTEPDLVRHYCDTEGHSVKLLSESARLAILHDRPEQPDDMGKTTWMSTMFLYKDLYICLWLQKDKEKQCVRMWTSTLGDEAPKEKLQVGISVRHKHDSTNNEDWLIRVVGGSAAVQNLGRGELVSLRSESLRNRLLAMYTLPTGGKLHYLMCDITVMPEDVGLETISEEEAVVDKSGIPSEAEADAEVPPILATAEEQCRVEVANVVSTSEKATEDVACEGSHGEAPVDVVPSIQEHVPKASDIESPEIVNVEPDVQEVPAVSVDTTFKEDPKVSEDSRVKDGPEVKPEPEVTGVNVSSAVEAYPEFTKEPEVTVISVGSVVEADHEFTKDPEANEDTAVKYSDVNEDQVVELDPGTVVKEVREVTEDEIVKESPVVQVDTTIKEVTVVTIDSDANDDTVSYVDSAVNEVDLDTTVTEDPVVPVGSDGKDDPGVKEDAPAKEVLEVSVDTAVKEDLEVSVDPALIEPDIRVNDVVNDPKVVTETPDVEVENSDKEDRAVNKEGEGPEVPVCTAVLGEPEITFDAAVEEYPEVFFDSALEWGPEVSMETAAKNDPWVPMVSAVKEDSEISADTVSKDAPEVPGVTALEEDAEIVLETAVKDGPEVLVDSAMKDPEVSLDDPEVPVDSAQKKDSEVSLETAVDVDSKVLGDTVEKNEPEIPVDSGIKKDPEVTEVPVPGTNVDAANKEHPDATETPDFVDLGVKQVSAVTDDLDDTVDPAVKEEPEVSIFQHALGGSNPFDLFDDLFEKATNENITYPLPEKLYVWPAANENIMNPFQFPVTSTNTSVPSEVTNAATIDKSNPTVDLGKDEKINVVDNVVSPTTETEVPDRDVDSNNKIIVPEIVVVDNID